MRQDLHGESRQTDIIRRNSRRPNQLDAVKQWFRAELEWLKRWHAERSARATAIAPAVEAGAVDVRSIWEPWVDRQVDSMVQPYAILGWDRRGL